MREPEIISSEIQDLEKVYLESKEMSLHYPDDIYIIMSVQQAEYRKALLMEELEKSLQHYGRHSIKYIFKDITEKINLDFLLDNLYAFKVLLDKAYNGVTEGRNNTMPVFFNTVFSGSYGIQLSTSFENTIGDNYFEDALEKTLGFMSDITSAEERNIRNHLDPHITSDKALLTKYNNFFKKVEHTNRKVEIVWNSPLTGEHKPIVIEPLRARILNKLFSEKEVTEETAQLIGILKGVSLISYKVEFVVNPETREYITAKFNEGLSESIKDLIDTYVYAEFRISKKYNELNDVEEKKYHLLKITAQGK